MAKPSTNDAAAGPNPPDSSELLLTTLNECRELYVSSGQLCSQQYPHLIKKSGAEFVQLMDDLHRALVLKIYVAVCEADKQWSKGEREMAEVLFQHLWNQRLTGDKLGAAAREAAQQTSKLRWYSLVRPFDRIVPLRERIGELETLVTRLANIVARADGTLGDREAAVIKTIRQELAHHLRQVPIDEATDHEEADAASGETIATIRHDASHVRAATAASEAVGQKLRSEILGEVRCTGRETNARKRPSRAR